MPMHRREKAKIEARIRALRRCHNSIEEFIPTDEEIKSRRDEIDTAWLDHRRKQEQFRRA